MSTSSAATRRKDRQIRESGDDYVDPARYRGKAGHVSKRLLSKNGKKSGKTSKRNRKKNLEDRAKRSGVEIDSTALEPTYTDDEKFALMYLCIRSSVKTVSQQEQIPENTLYGWFRQVGGIDSVRSFVASRAEVSFYDLIDSTAQEIRHRLKDASDEELFETFRTLVSAADKAGLSAPERRGRGAGESDGVLTHGEANRITLNFGSSPPGTASQGKDEDEEKVSVFDE